jgi:hypothetical protein
MTAPVLYNGTLTTSNATLYTAPAGGETAFSSLVAVSSTDLAAPAQPSTSTATTGGTVAAGTYTVEVTYVTASGETTPSAAKTQVTTGSTSTLTVSSPGASTGATGWYAYVSQVNGTGLTRQQAAGSPTAIGTGLTLTAPPSGTGAAPPVQNTSGANANVTLTIVRAISGVTETVAAAVTLQGSWAYSALDDPRLAEEGVFLSPGDTLQGFATLGSAVQVVAF